MLLIIDRQHRESRWAACIVVLVFLVAGLGLTTLKVVSTQTSESTHIASNNRSSFRYSSTPPTSGPHYSSIAGWAVYAEPLRYEQVLHNLEEGGVAIYYQCEQPCPELVAQLEEIVTPYLASGRKVLLLPNVPTWTHMYNPPWHQDMDTRIAVTAWHQIEKYNEILSTRIQTFIENYEGIDHHQASE